MNKFKSTYIVFFLLAFTFAVNAQKEIPTLKQYATDYTNTLSSSQLTNINRALSAFYDSTSNQIAFLMINTLDDYPIEMYAVETAEKNNIGTKENDNGVLFVVAKDDRKMRIEVGYGLEGAIPDAMASSIIRNEVRPWFIRENYYNGIATGLSSLMEAAVGEYRIARRQNRGDDDEHGFGFIVYIILFILMMIFGGRGRGLLFLPLIFGAGGGGRRGGGGFGGFSGGGGGGGGFGGFSGGGGSFGGGGASGGW